MFFVCRRLKFEQIGVFIFCRCRWRFLPLVNHKGSRRQTRTGSTLPCCQCLTRSPSAVGSPLPSCSKEPGVVFMAAWSLRGPEGAGAAVGKAAVASPFSALRAVRYLCVLARFSGGCSTPDVRHAEVCRRVHLTLGFSRDSSSHRYVALSLPPQKQVYNYFF